MNSSDRLSADQVARLALAIVATAEVLGQTLTADAAELMADDLADYPAEAVGAALKACRRQLAGKLTLAAILERVQAADGRPGKDEAWSIGLSSSDEFETVVLTEEIRQAMAAAAPILKVGDKVGARMAFLSTYERLVQQARGAAVPVSWSISVGFDAQRRIAAVEQAERLGRVSPAIAAEQRLLLGHEAPTKNGRAIAGLITGNPAPATADVQARLAVIRDDLAKSRREKEERRQQAVVQATQDLDDRRAQALAAIEQMRRAKS